MEPGSANVTGMWQAVIWYQRNQEVPETWKKVAVATFQLDFSPQSKSSVGVLEVFVNDEASGSFNFYPGCGSAEWQSFLAHVEVMDYISLPFFLKQLHKRALFILFFISELRTHFYLSEAERYCRILLVFSQSCPTLCDPRDCSTSGFSVFHCLPEFAQTHAHWVSSAIQPSHPLLLSSPPALNLSLHQGLFQWVSSLHQVAKVLEL